MYRQSIMFSLCPEHIIPLMLSSKKTKIGEYFGAMKNEISDKTSYLWLWHQTVECLFGIQLTILDPKETLSKVREALKTIT